MLQAINRPGRFVTCDQVAARLIERDPSMLLIDVRTAADYADYALEGAIFVGFTGTPLLRKDRQTTREVFGTYIHTYKFQEAVRDATDAGLSQKEILNLVRRLIRDEGEEAK